MTVRWTVRAANDRGPQAESRFPQGVPKKDLFFDKSFLFAKKQTG